MAFLEIKNVKVSGISACCPHAIEDNAGVYSKWGGYDNFLTTTGIARRRIADKNTCASDLCIKAAEKLISELGWEKDSIDAVVFVTQTPDYMVPATSPMIQDKLGLSEECYTLDISLGCSGWVYAMSVLASLLQNGTMKRGLLMAGDTPVKFCSKEDKSTYPLFGDAGTVTALEYNENVNSMYFTFNSDGSGKNAIIIEEGGYRNLINNHSFELKEYGEGIIRSNMELSMDGMSVFSFAISKAPKSVNGLLRKFNLDKEHIDYFIFHQANLFLNEKIRKKLNIEAQKVPYCLDDYGNTSCASIPLTLVTRKSNELQSRSLKIVGCGFGVGLSWGSIYFETNNIVCPDLIEI